MYQDKYYNQTILWKQNPEQYQVQLLADILSMLPKDTKSILDVGCGNGVITNALPEPLDVVGLDSSEEALKSVSKKKQVGSITSLPFLDDSFDLVLCTDVIEHLPKDIYDQGISEMFRVASKYVLIAVPYGEQLHKSLTKCSDCDFVYHINHHQRSFYEQDLATLAPQQEWKVHEIRYSGNVTRPPLDPFHSSFVDILEAYVNCESCICPNCGSNKTVNSMSHKTKKILGNLRSKCFFSVNKNNLTNQHINRSEAIALYKASSINLKKSNDNTKVFQEKNFSPLLIDFDNLLQKVRDGFVEGCFWAKYYDPNFKDRQDNETQGQEEKIKSILMHFPVVPEVGDKIIVKVDFKGNLAIKESDPPEVSLIAHDELNNETILIGKLSDFKNSNLEFQIDKTWQVNTFGCAITIKTNQIIKLRSVEYIQNKPNAVRTIPFLLLEKGHNILETITTQNYIRSWGLLVDSSSYYPKPEWLWATNIRVYENYKFPALSFKDYQKLVEKTIELREKKISSLSSFLEAKERERSQAENAYQKMTQEVSRLSSLLEAKERERSQAETAHERSSKFETFFFKNAQRRISRVLVLSHMFPKEQQPNLGCFVAEQVKALREYEGLDVRVVSCQPFWCNTKNPLRLASAISEYRKALNVGEWFYYNDIPTLFVPYLVGSPFFPFHVHGFTYRNSIKNIASRIRKEFNFDLIHAHTAYLDGFAGLYLANKYQVPLAITEHTNPLDFLINKPLIRQITINSFEKASSVIGVSPDLYNKIKTRLSPNQHHKLVYLPNGLDDQLFQLSINNGKRNNKKHQLELLTVTALEPYKNPFCLLKAFNILLKRNKNIKLTIVGDGSLLDEVKNWIVNYRLDDVINLLDRQSRSEVARLMREQCDIFVLSSRSETFGVVLIEAMASGKPVVSTRCGGPDSIITDPDIGELCESDNPNALAQAIEKVNQNLHNYNPQKIRDFALKNYSYQKLATQLSELYQTL